MIQFLLLFRLFLSVNTLSDYLPDIQEIASFDVVSFLMNTCTFLGGSVAFFLFLVKAKFGYYMHSLELRTVLMEG
jgi:hypothetical protein